MSFRTSQVNAISANICNFCMLYWDNVRRPLLHGPAVRLAVVTYIFFV